MRLMPKANNPRRSTLNDILIEDGTLGEINEIVTKERLAWQIAQLMKKKKLTKIKMAAAMKASLAQLDRVLDPKSRNVTLTALQKAANAVGKTLMVSLM